MGSRKEEERNEKIIRGLMKLPPNRRCINCNSLGPQYVCTNFWSFVCTTCSGIHREFTHRVKSVSMAKFNSQEVEALQNGGNQRAREIYLKNWDLQRQRLPDSSNVEKIRNFIKDVYVGQKYTGGKTSEKPPRDVQNRGICEDETRRASSYHSYSQSPPYDYQYEDRRYGKHAAVLTRKPGSDRGRYEGKISSFVYSPGRLSDQMNDDRFANEGSISRVSDYSVSSGGDPFRSGTQSPNFQKDVGFSSPPFYHSRNASNEDMRRQAVDSFQERSRSSGSFGSIDSNFVSLQSFNSGVTDVAQESEQANGTQRKTHFTGSPVPGSSDSLDLFNTPSVPQAVSSAAPIDLFQLPVASSPPSVDLFEPSLVSSASSKNAFQPPQISTASLDLFASTAQPHSAAAFGEKLPEFSSSKNEGWATFDMPPPSVPITSNENSVTTNKPSGDVGSIGKVDLFSSLETFDMPPPPASIPSNENTIPTNTPVDGGFAVKVDLFSSLGTSMQWPAFQDSGFHGPSLNVCSPWNDSFPGIAPPTTTNTQLWNAFEDPAFDQPTEGIKQDGAPLVGSDRLPSTANQPLGFSAPESSGKDGIQSAASSSEVPDPVASSVVVGPPYATSMLNLMGETQSHSTDRKSNNPFDLPYDSELEQTDMFLDTSSLQAALPDPDLSSGFLGGVAQPWFPQNPVTPYIPAAGQGGLTYMTPQAPTSQIPNVPAQGHVASMGGNPFA
ncbi:hypothetical protein UlMin_006717 [Ulmus minor]